MAVIVEFSEFELRLVGRKVSKQFKEGFLYARLLCNVHLKIMVLLCGKIDEIIFLSHLLGVKGDKVMFSVCFAA